jgi:hypothetical protein
MANPQLDEPRGKGVPPRPELSPADRDFVRDQAEQLALKVRTILFDDYTRKHSPEYRQSAQEKGEQLVNIGVAQTDEDAVEAIQQDISAQILAKAPNQLQRQLAISSSILEDAAVKKVLPELAFIELQQRFDKIHTAGRLDGFTPDELTKYLSTAQDLHAGASLNLHTTALQYVVHNFDRFSQLDRASWPHGVTITAILSGVQQFSETESKISELKLAPYLVKGLSYLNEHFDALQGAGESGLCKDSLESYMRTVLPKEDPGRAILSDVLDSFNDFSYLDPNDGDRLWYKLWLGHGNAECITHRDIAAGLEEVRVNPKKISDLEKVFDSWPK